MNRGYMIVAQNTDTVDYIKCAKVLAHNIKTIMPNSSVTLLTDAAVTDIIFDNVIKFPYGDHCSGDSWKLANDWQVYDSSPYQYTIKIEADMYLPRSIEYWWDILKHRDINICTTIRNYRGEISTVDAYRGVFVANNLPQTYNALTYFKKCEVADRYYSIVRNVFENWIDYKQSLKKCADIQATTDVAYGIASSIIGVEQTTLPHFTDMSMIHMKSLVNETSARWNHELTSEILPQTLRINSHTVRYPLHYHVKDYAYRLWSELYE